MRHTNNNGLNLCTACLKTTCLWIFNKYSDPTSPRLWVVVSNINYKIIINTSVVSQVWEGHWRVIPFHVLPEWLKDNDYLLHGHRPPMPSFRACFGSIFRIHTETGNIWTHLLGDNKNLYILNCGKCAFSSSFISFTTLCMFNYIVL